MVISTAIRLSIGPTFVGDADSDPVSFAPLLSWSSPWSPLQRVMKLLEATLTQQLGNNFAEYVTQLTPRAVLDRVGALPGLPPGPRRLRRLQLEEDGWRLAGMCGVGQTCVWTLNRPTSPIPPVPSEYQL